MCIDRLKCRFNLFLTCKEWFLHNKREKSLANGLGSYNTHAVEYKDASVHLMTVDAQWFESFTIIFVIAFFPAKVHSPTYQVSLPCIFVLERLWDIILQDYYCGTKHFILKYLYNLLLHTLSKCSWSLKNNLSSLLAVGSKKKEIMTLWQEQGTLEMVVYMAGISNANASGQLYCVLIYTWYCSTKTGRFEHRL